MLTCSYKNKWLYYFYHRCYLKYSIYYMYGKVHSFQPNFLDLCSCIKKGEALFSSCFWKMFFFTTVQENGNMKDKHVWGGSDEKVSRIWLGCWNDVACTPALVHCTVQFLKQTKIQIFQNVSYIYIYYIDC